MTWQEKILEFNGGNPITLFATATTGLKPTNSKLLAVSYAKVSSGDTVLSTGRILKSVPDDVAMTGHEFHKFGPDFVREKGIPDDAFRTELKSALNGLCFSYNPKFQVGFLELEIGEDTPFVHDLLLMLKGAEMKLCLDKKVISDIHTLEKFFANRLGKTPGLRTMCLARDLVADPPLATFPVDYYVDCLIAFWQMLANFDVCYQEDLF